MYWKTSDDLSESSSEQSEIDHASKELHDWLVSKAVDSGAFHVPFSEACNADLTAIKCHAGGGVDLTIEIEVEFDTVEKLCEAFDYSLGKFHEKSPSRIDREREEIRHLIQLLSRVS